MNVARSSSWRVGNSKGGAFQKQSYQYYFQASLWEFMKFMNFFENYDRFVGVRDFIEKNKDGIAAALPATGLTADRLIRVALTAIMVHSRYIGCQ